MHNYDSEIRIEDGNYQTNTVGRVSLGGGKSKSDLLSMRSNRGSIRNVASIKGDSFRINEQYFKQSSSRPLRLDDQGRNFSLETPMFGNTVAGTRNSTEHYNPNPSIMLP